MNTSPKIPQPRPYPVLGNTPEVGMRTPVQSMVRLGKKYGPLYRMTFPAGSLLVASSHELVSELSDESRFDKKIHAALKNIRDFAADGLFTARTEEPNWEKAHRLLLPAFGPGAMRGYFDAMLDIAEQMVAKWERLGPRTAIDVPDTMTRLTLDTIALCGFGYRFNSFYQREMHPFVDSMVRCLEESGARGRRLPLQTKLMLTTARVYDEDIAFMNEVVDTVIRERRAEQGEARHKDLLSLMLSGLDDLNVRHQIITFLIAGHETTSALLSFAVYALLEHPEVLARARAEADEVFGSYPAEAPTFEQLPRLKYIEQVLKETLRLWPTAPAYAVYALEDTVIGGQWAVKAREAVMVLTPLLHRDETVWTDPERFDPERFSPERAATIPPHAWKPFGNGQRACIGRQFAMQEAILLLGLLLRRFDLLPLGEYKLKIKETLTLKPEGLFIHARPRKDLQVVKPSPVSAASLPKAFEAMEQHDTPLLVLYGSNTGSAEAFARKLAGEAAVQGYVPTVAPLDDHAGRLTAGTTLIVVTSSYNGKPPDNAGRFCDWLDTVPTGELEGMRFLVFGCGHRDWASTYQAVPKRIDAALERAGGERIVTRGEADAGGDYYTAFDTWLGAAWSVLAKTLGLAVRDTSAAPLDVERLSVPSEALTTSHGLVRSELLENRELVDITSPFGRSKRHVVLRLPEGTSYAPGDHLAVLPENPPEQVERVARRFALSPDDHVVLRRPGSNADAPFLPLNQPVLVRHLLGRHIELSSPATRRDLERLVRFTSCPPEKMRLEQILAMSDDQFRETINDRRTAVIDLLEQAPACELPFGVFLEMAPPLRPRRYSIASSPLADPRRCVLTVAVVEAMAWSGLGRFRGACSNYLQRAAAGQTVATSVHPNPGFHLPDDPSTPLVLIAAGTGLAPFRGFVEHRSLQAKAGVALGPALLFFGCDHPDVDFLYRDEIAAWEAEGLVQAFPAFYRCDGAMFVQHRLWAERERVKALLDQGAAVFVCGDGRNMTPAVHETLARIGGDGGEAWLEALEKDGRYRKDVFGG